jgi:hypothetical protein
MQLKQQQPKSQFGFHIFVFQQRGAPRGESFTVKKRPSQISVKCQPLHSNELFFVHFFLFLMHCIFLDFSIEFYPTCLVSLPHNVDDNCHRLNSGY